MDKIAGLILAGATLRLVNTIKKRKLLFNANEPTNKSKVSFSSSAKRHMEPSDNPSDYEEYRSHI